MLSRSRRVATVAAVAACLLALTACGKDASPTTDPTSDPSGQGQIGDAPTGSATTTPATTTSSSGSGGGGGGGTQTSPYPGNAKDYGLEILKAIGAKDNARLAALADLNTVNYSQQYQNKNAQWSNTDCADGATVMCHYFNQTGDIASVGIEKAKLGKQQAGNSVYLDQGTYPTDASGYVQSFVYSWALSPNYARMVALSSSSIANFYNGQPSKPTVGYVSNVYNCQSNASKKCVDAATELAGGGPFGKIYHFIVDPSKISTGKPGGIVGYENPDTTWRA